LDPPPPLPARVWVGVVGVAAEAEEEEEEEEARAAVAAVGESALPDRRPRPPAVMNSKGGGGSRGRKTGGAVHHSGDDGVVATRAPAPMRGPPPSRKGKPQRSPCRGSTDNSTDNSQLTRSRGNRGDHRRRQRWRGQRLSPAGQTRHRRPDAMVAAAAAPMPRKQASRASRVAAARVGPLRQSPLERRAHVDRDGRSKKRLLAMQRRVATASPACDYEFSAQLRRLQNNTAQPECPSLYGQPKLFAADFMPQRACGPKPRHTQRQLVLQHF
jgi:hypothetical protein